MKYDFGGYATKNDIKCTDGRIIRKDAFKHHDGEEVPLVWQHLHDSVDNVLGKVILENRKDGVYAKGIFNDTPNGLNAKALVQHGDVTSLSIYANQLKEQSGNVMHGVIREVSLVLAGANPGAKIENVTLEHSDGSVDSIDTEAVITLGSDSALEIENLEHSDAQNKKADTGKTVQEVYDSMTDEQKELVLALVGEASSKNLEDDGKEDEEDEDVSHSDKGGNFVKKNVFEEGKKDLTSTAVISHDGIKAIINTLIEDETKLSSAVLKHAGTYGIDNINLLFPDAKELMNTPRFISRNTTWVSGVLAATKHSPFSRIKTTFADITEDEARAKGYVTGDLKTEEVFSLLQRVTHPTTIYKKQKLDRDDIIDITSFDVVAWMKVEMRFMLNEEIARAILIGDGRSALSKDKIKEINVRPIYKDDDFYSHKVAIANNATIVEQIDKVFESRVHYKGSGNATFYTTSAWLTAAMLVRNSLGERIYKTQAELASAMGVKDIVEVQVFENQTRTNAESVVLSLVGIMVNLVDYTIGADKGGEINFFDDFDIDYNQEKYLMETRISGALTEWKAAVVFEKLPPAQG